MSFDAGHFSAKVTVHMSQSLSNRAMSFDSLASNEIHEFSLVSIPFEQGDVFRHWILTIRIPKQQVSIPFEQGDVFRP